MEEEIEKVLNQYYNHKLPVISELRLLDVSLAPDIFCLRWRVEKDTITIKSIKNEDTYIITQLQ